MRPPSYYSSLANSQPQRGNTNSSLQLRSSLSNPSSTSYATRNHLPFVSQSMLVAHCYTGTTRPYGSHSTGSNTSTGSYNNSYSRPRSTKHHTNPYLAASTYSSAPYSTYSAPSVSSASSSSSSRYLSGASSALSSTLRPLSSSYRSSYTPSSSSSSYYKPIRLRERPLLNQISHHINSSGRLASRPTLRSEHSEIRDTNQAANEDRPSRAPTEKTKEESWQSDVARNISRNKYLIKFKEFDRRSSPAPIQLTNRIETKEQPVEVGRSPDSISDEKQLEAKAEKVGERSEEQASISASMKVPIVVPALVERLEEKPLQVNRQSPKTIDDTCLKRVPLSQVSGSSNKQADASETDTISTHQQTNPASRGDEICLDDGKLVKKKAPREKKNIKLKLKSLNKNGEQVNEGEPKTAGKLKKVVSPKQSPETVASETSPAIKVKAKKLVKTSKRQETDQVSPADRKSVDKVSETATKVSGNLLGNELPRPEKQVDLVVSKTKAKSDQSVVGASEPNKAAPSAPTATAAAAVAKKEVIEQKEPVSASPEVLSGATLNKRIRFREYHIDDFNFLSVLGHGGWGFVILAELKEHDACFAVKCIKKITIVEDDDFDSIMIERKMLTLGNVHPFICKLFCTFETDGYLFFVMEYCPGGDLMFHVQKEGKFTESRCRFYAAEIICAMRYLHNQHIIYRDLKLDNILLDSQGHIRLVDFGMCQCRTYREEMLPSNFCGTPEYISPEIIKGVPYNHSVDWWSFGVLLYEMAVGKMPFRGNDENELLWNVCYEQIHYPMFLTRELTTLLQSLLEREPTKRMGMSTCKLGDIYEQAWFRGVDWASVEKMRVKPPFVPEVLSKRDVQNFDADFTESAPELSPVDEATLSKIDQNQFQKFPYTNPNISIFD